ncbi:hypothetical protein RHSIM_Rhsim01G0041300 [Rhododendron simsii]|uniref:GH18 domain-containing protein n=1 Tax=Rhododendron simsii TaxID=118357 RepID=A0A834LTS0_RHOSS|nr:hypothetical protein RHSIM_Rhsim01G0041300 [Rhododendron simsii]
MYNFIAQEDEKDPRNKRQQLLAILLPTAATITLILVSVTCMAILRSGQEIAVKRLSSTSTQIFPFLSRLFPSPISTAQTFVNSVYWFPDSGLAASDIDSTLFTHIFCAFADLDSNTKQVTISSSNNASFSQFTKTVQLKNPSVKTLLSIGSGSANRTVFASMASQSASRKSFIDSSIKLARSYGFYGLDLDWEYPQSTSEMANLGALLNEWRAAVATEANSSGKPPLLLTAAFYYASSINGLNYPVQLIHIQ